MDARALEGKLQALEESYRQMIEGVDILCPERMLKNIKPEKAAIKLPHMPYSILTNVAHADFWQRIWLDRLEGRRAESITKDWRVPEPQEWPEVRSSFLRGMNRAFEIIRARPFGHVMKSDDAALKTLTQILVHDSYHLGQVNLLKRSLRLSSTSVM